MDEILLEEIPQLSLMSNNSSTSKTISEYTKDKTRKIFQIYTHKKTTN
jgi:hypothetical protein